MHFASNFSVNSIVMSILQLNYSIVVIFRINTYVYMHFASNFNVNSTTGSLYDLKAVFQNIDIDTSEPIY